MDRGIRKSIEEKQRQEGLDEVDEGAPPAAQGQDQQEREVGENSSGEETRRHSSDSDPQQREKPAENGVRNGGARTEKHE